MLGFFAKAIAIGGGLILVYILVSQPATPNVVSSLATGSATLTKALQGR